MNILFTCGGTAGHVNPAVALARIFQQQYPDCRILFVGADGGMETKLRTAAIATASGADMIIANGKDVSIIHRIFENDYKGTLFAANYDEDFYIVDMIEDSIG